MKILTSATAATVACKSLAQIFEENGLIPEEDVISKILDMQQIEKNNNSKK